jgi:hypothetical protein
MGDYNESVAADPDNQGNAGRITQYEQTAVTNSEARMHAVFLREKLAIPATVNLDQMKSIGVDVCVYELYWIRGKYDKANAYEAKLIDAMQRLEELCFMNRGGFTHSAGYSDAPVAVPATVDADGRPVSTITRVPFFNGLYLQW